MSNEELISALVDMYNCFYWGITNNFAFKLDLTINKQDKEVENFFKRLSKKGNNVDSLGIDFLNKYLGFQFAYWLDKDIKRRNVSLSWIIGKKAIDRWEAIENIENALYWTNIRLLEKGVDMYEIKYLFDIESRVSYVESEVEDIERKRFYNEVRGLLNCLERTTLYIKSSICFSCKFKLDCKKILRSEYPELYIKRKIV